MITKPISTLKVQKLTQEQYDTAFQNGTLDNDSIYLTPTEIKDYALRSDLETKADLVDGKIATDQLHTATSLQLGTVKVGSNLSVTDDGTLSANIPTTWDWNFITNPPSLYTQSEVDTKLDDKQKKNLVTSISSTSTDAEYPSAKAVYDQLANKQDVLTFDSAPTANSANPVTSGGVKTALDGIVKVAEGKCATYVFDYYDTLYDTLVGENQDLDFILSLNDGDIFLIRDLTVPDYWWERQTNIMMLAAQEYNDIVVSGYGAARVLETTKIDLTDYALKGDIPATLPANGGNADTIDNYHIRTASEGDKGLAGYITFVI